MTFHELNLLSKDELRETLFECCGSHTWVEKMLPFFSVDDLVELLEDAEEQWWPCSESDWKEAFTHHPQIGDTTELKKKFAATAEMVAGEQSQVQYATDETIAALAAGNKTYREKFGYIFIVCATGKSAEEMLQLLNERLNNSPAAEIEIAADEQIKITQLRLQKLIQ